MNDLPPKTVKVQLVRLDDNLKQIERRQVAGIQRAPGSLPVLEAFQTFLEHEREKARRRMLALTAVALLLMIAAAGGGMMLVKAQMRKTATDVAQVQGRTDALSASVAAMTQQKEQDLNALETRFDGESRRIVAQYEALLEAQTALSGKVGESGTALETLEERLDRLETENESLRSRLAAFLGGSEDTPVPQVVAEAGTTETAGETTATAAAASDGDAEPLTVAAVAATSDGDAEPLTVAAAETAAVTVVEHPTALLMTIVPRGQSHGIRWMLPRNLTLE